MCGRFTLRTPAHRLADAFGVRELPNLPPRYNIAPTQDAAVVRHAQEGERELAMLRWGLVPPWSAGPESAYSMINARAETVTTKPAFRAAFRHRRCLVPADGFYEWQKVNGGKQPYLVELADGDPFAFAGLWERWEGQSGEGIESFTIIVTEANEVLRPIHDRMPVIVDPPEHDLWLDGGPTVAQAAENLLRPYPAERMVAHPVSRRVNNPRYDDPTCVAAPQTIPEDPGDRR